jgi:magnesium chelatase family protein
MFAAAHSSCIVALDAVPVEVEVTLRNGTERFTILGLGGAAVRESRDRIHAALRHVGFDPPEVILVNLAPAEVRKESAAFDLPIALAIVCAMGGVSSAALQRMAICGELSLTGEVKGSPGVVAHAVSAAENGFEFVMVPEESSADAAVISGVKVIGVASLSEAIRILNGQHLPEIRERPRGQSRQAAASLDDVMGQEAAKRALTIAAAGGHNMLMIGPPGCGKSMLAERLAGLLPDLAQTELLEVLRIHSVAGLPISPLLSGARPFRSPHHVVSDAGLIGGGAGPRPGEVSLAHRGVLFLDEFPEFRRSTIEALRSPLETGCVQVARARASVNFPARFQLIAAMNPCPCGRFGSKQGVCRCPHYAVREYLSRLSQPILDRIDLHVELEAVAVEDLVWAAPRQSTVGSGDGGAADAVRIARELQIQRQGVLNSEVPEVWIRTESQITHSARTLLSEAIRRLGMSARGYVRVLRVSRTIADLQGLAEINDEVVAEAVSYRSLERLANVVHNGGVGVPR